MVNETLDIAVQILDFNLDTLTQHAQLQRSYSGSCCTENYAPQQQQHTQPDPQPSSQQQPPHDPLSVSLHTQLQPSSTENLSWKFFEHVSTLDNQLRVVEESSTVVRANGGHLIGNETTTITTTTTTTAAASTYEATVAATDGQPKETIARQSNGIVNNLASITSDDILSQQSPDLIRTKPEQLPTQHSTFRFTSPTSTFKRKKKQQQQQQQQLYHQSHSNNNTHTNTNNQSNKTLNAVLATTTTTPLINNQLPLPTTVAVTQRPVSVNLSAITQTQSPTTTTTAKQHNATLSPMMLSGAGASNSTAAATASATTPATVPTTAGSIIGIGIGTRVPLKTRALPAITTATAPAPTASRQAYAADGVDLVGGHTKATTAGAVGAVTDHHLARMGAKLTASGAAAGAGNHSNSSGNSNNNNNSHHKEHCAFIDGIETHLALIGWRKKCLYTLLLLLMLLIITNLVLTLWILKVMEFSTEGMGQLKIVPGGIQLSGQALIMDMLRASTIRSRHGQPIAIESSRNFSINTRDTNGLLENHLFLGHDKLECLSTGFRINDTAGRNLFSVNRNEVTIGAHALRIDGEGGAIFRESIQTPHVRAEPGSELRLESPTRQLELTAARDINLQSRAGGIELSALGDVKLSALDGSLRLESAKILMPNLRTAQPPTLGAPQSRDHLHRVFQLCACSNGKLFLAAPHSICAGDDSTVCR